MGTLLASALLALGTSVGFGIVAALMLRRQMPDRGRAALVLFCLFWSSACVIWAAQGLQNLSAAFGAASFGLVSALDQVGTTFYCLGGAGLLYYALYLATGRERLLVPILVYYLLVFFLLRWRVEDAHRLAVEVRPWLVNFQYERPLQGPVYSLLVVALAGPLLAAVLAYAALLFRVRDAASRYRIALTSLGLFAWIATEAFSYTSGFANTAQGEITRRVVALTSGFVVVLAYLPPAWARRRWHARARDEAPQHAGK